MPLITVEGIDGAGKTTLVAALGVHLGVTPLREPGGVVLAEEIRALVKTRDCDPRTEALLFAAARAELVAREIAPGLARGETILVDRFSDSSLAYQGAGRELGLDAIRAINAFAPVPDVTLLLRIDPDVALARAGARAEGPADRFENAGFLRRVAAGYDVLADAEPARFRVLDATQPRGLVLEAALAALGARG